MEVLEITNFKTNKVKIILDTGIAFVLYKGDLVKYKINIGEVREDYIEYILYELLPKRALARAVNIVAVRDVTSGMLYDKLEGDGYPEEIINNVVERMINDRLIDDERFIRGYIEAKSQKKSKNDIFRELNSKGLDMNLVENIYDELKEDDLLKDEKLLIKELLIKKHFDMESASYEDINKMVQYLARKGFDYDSIRSAMREE